MNDSSSGATQSNESQKTERRGFLKAAAGASVGIMATSLSANAAAVPGGENADPPPRPKGFFLPFAVNDHELGKRFLNDPLNFLKQLNISPDCLDCPPEVHQAFERGQECADEFDRELADTGNTPLEMVSVARRVIPKYLGEDYRVTIQPYGLQFRERIPIHDMATLGSTVSGTFTITFADKDVDVDD